MFAVREKKFLCFYKKVDDDDDFTGVQYVDVLWVLDQAIIYKSSGNQYTHTRVFTLISSCVICTFKNELNWVILLFYKEWVIL